jgi:quinoprotein glucose dehydrogenase
VRLLAATALALYSLTGWAQGWPFYGGNSGGTHYSAAAQIDRNNVDQLEVAWIHRSGDSKLPDHLLQKTSGQSTPILLPPAAGASLVYCSALNKVMALDPGSGAQRWAYDPKINVQTERPLRCRGVTYYEETRVTPGEPCRHRIFTITYDRRLIALDALDGKRCKDFGNKGEVGQFGNDMSTDYISNSSPPVAAAGLIIAGSAVIDFHYAKAPRGTVQAFDSLTGKLTWSFDPVAGLKNSGGANVWAPMSIDENLNLLYLPTSAASPDYYGVNRPGDNGYANSVVALDLQSGEVRWHFQHVRHDLWDYDSPAQPILFDWKKNGASIPALAQPTKQGFVFVLDRRTGESLWEITEQPVPPSQIPGEMAATDATQADCTAPLAGHLSHA